MSQPGGGLARRLAANTLHAASGRVVAIVLWLVLTPPILRAIGTEGYAVWSFFFALTGSLNALDLGLAPGTLRNVAAARARGDMAEAGEFATLGAIGYVVLGVAWLALTPLMREPLMAFLRVPPAVHDVASFAFVAGAIVFSLTGLTNITIAVAQAHDRFDLANRVSLTSSIAQIGGILWVLRTHHGLHGILVVTGFAWALAGLAGVFALALGVRGFHWGSPWRSLGRTREAVAFGGPMQVSNILSVAHQQLDKMLLSRYVAFALVTPYDLALRAATAASTFPQLLLLAVLPAASVIHSTESPARLQELYDRGNRWVLFASALVVAAVLAGAERIFVAWLGHAEPAGAMALRALALTSAVALATGMGTSVARGIGRTDLEAEFAFVALLVHVGVGLWLVPTRGLPGALIAVLTGNLAGATWFLVRLGGVLGWSRRSLLLAPFGVPAIATLLGAGMGWALARALPPVAGPLAWAAALAVGVVSATVAALVAFGTRYMSIREAGRLLSGAVTR